MRIPFTLAKAEPAPLCLKAPSPSSGSHATLLWVFLFLLLCCLGVGCSPSSPSQPTSTPQPVKSKLRIESFLALDKTGARGDSIRVLAGDTINTEIVLSGLQDDGTGKVVGTVTLTLTGVGVDAVQLQAPTKDFQEAFVDDGRLSLTTSSTVQVTDPPGTYRLTALVVDKSADLEVEKQLSVIVEQPSAASPTPDSAAPLVQDTPKPGGPSDPASPSAAGLQVTSLEFASSEEGPGMDPAIMAAGSKAFIRYELTGLTRDASDHHTALSVNVKVTRPDGSVEGPAQLASDEYPPEMEAVKGTFAMQASPDDPPGLYHMEMSFVDEVSKGRLIAKFVYTLQAP